MKTSFSKTQLSLAVTCALVLGFASSAARAQSLSPNEREIWTESSRSQVWKNGFGECWHSAYGPPPAYNECNPAPVAQNAPAPAPRPVVVAAAAPTPVAQKVTFDADVLFDFDKAVLRPEGKAVLDSFAGQLPGIKLETISVIGHADRFGTDEYNKVLSDKRAATVKDYLTAKGLEPGRMYAEGKGESQPVTKSGDCQGPKSAKVIACLQPDRRVDVEVIGTRAAK